MNETRVLAVDLDGTLLRSDMLFEDFWSATARDWTTPWRAMATLRQGRAALKRDLAAAARIDIATLPYDPAVIERVREWRMAGGVSALVTASDQGVADAIAAHLGIFDEVHGSDGRTNLKGPEKARFLAQRYGQTGYVYMGDSRADLPVWQQASKAITVNSSRAVRTNAERLGIEVEHLRTAPAVPWLRAMRPHQWSKNILVFLPMLTGHVLTAQAFLLSLLAFIAFSLVASSLYMLNDLLDLSADRAHPRKRERPFASGSLPIGSGSVMAVGLFLAGLLISVLLGWQFTAVIASYVLVSMAYSLTLKRRVVIDICALAALYTFRIIAGAMATQIPLSVWMLAFSIFLFFALAAVKRQAELVDNIERGKLDIYGRGYHVNDLPVISMMATSSAYVAILVLALYVNSPSVVDLYSTPQILWGICFIMLYWLSRIIMLTHRGHMQDDPVLFALHDRNSLICFAAVVALAVAGAVL